MSGKLFFIFASCERLRMYFFIFASFEPLRLRIPREVKYPLWSTQISYNITFFSKFAFHGLMNVSILQIHFLHCSSVFTKFGKDMDFRPYSQLPVLIGLFRMPCQILSRVLFCLQLINSNMWFLYVCKYTVIDTVAFTIILK